MSTPPPSRRQPGWVFFLAGCVASPSAPPGADPPPDVPTILEAAESCDPVYARWNFSAEADAWTGNGQVLLSTDGRYLEVHPLDSKTAAGDGSSDRLALSLGVVGDWRYVSLGTTTVFNCLEPGLAGILRIFEQNGETEADCRFFGEQKWEQWNLGYGCNVPLEAP